MTQTFEDRKTELLSDLHLLALRHNRDYYISMIPFIEKAGPEDADLIEIYHNAIDEDKTLLIQSRQAFEGVTKIVDILSV